MNRSVKWAGGQKVEDHFPSIDLYRPFQNLELSGCENSTTLSGDQYLYRRRLSQFLILYKMHVTQASASSHEMVRKEEEEKSNRNEDDHNVSYLYD